MRRFIESILFGLAYLIVNAYAIAVIVYILVIYFGEKGETPSFELALISAVIGGFVLASAFFSKASTDLQLKIRRAGATYLVATLAFVVFTICLPIIDKLPTEMTFLNITLPVNLNYITAGIVAVSIVIGAFSFAIGTVMIASMIFRLWRKSHSGII